MLSTALCGLLAYLIAFSCQPSAFGGEIFLKKGKKGATNARSKNYLQPFNPYPLQATFAAGVIP